jgi:hypothetical protein
MATKVLLFFSDNNGYGWSETYWYLGSASPPIADTSNLAYYRQAMMTSEVGLTYGRITGVVSRNPYLLNFQYQAGPQPAPSAPDFAALLVKLQNPTLGYGRHYIRGIPQNIVDEDFYTPTAQFNTAFRAWANYIQGGLWGIRSTLGTSGPKQYILSLTPTGTKGYSFVIAGAQVFAVGNTITVHGCKVVGYNGTKTVVNLTAVSTPVAGFVYQVGGGAPATAEPSSTVPWAQLQNPGYGVIGSVLPERITHRPPGRFFGARRGRRNSIVPLRQ